MIKIGRFIIKIFIQPRRFWFQSFKPSWFHENIGFITLSLFFIGFYAGDPNNFIIPKLFR